MFVLWYIHPACKKTLLWHITYMSFLWQIGLWCSTITFSIRKLTLILPLSLSGLYCCQGSMLIWFSNFQLFSNKSDPKDSHWIDRTKKIAEKTWTLFSTICYNNINITIHRRQFILDVFGKRFAKGLPLKACGLKLSHEAWILKVLNWTIQYFKIQRVADSLDNSIKLTLKLKLVAIICILASALSFNVYMKLKSFLWRLNQR